MECVNDVEYCRSHTAFTMTAQISYNPCREEITNPDGLWHTAINTSHPDADFAKALITRPCHTREEVVDVYRDFPNDRASRVNRFLNRNNNLNTHFEIMSDGNLYWFYWEDGWNAQAGCCNENSEEKMCRNTTKWGFLVNCSEGDNVLYDSPGLMDHEFSNTNLYTRAFWKWRCCTTVENRGTSFGDLWSVSGDKRYQFYIQLLRSSKLVYSARLGLGRHTRWCSSLRVPCQSIWCACNAPNVQENLAANNTELVSNLVDILNLGATNRRLEETHESENYALRVKPNTLARASARTITSLHACSSPNLTRCGHSWGIVTSTSYRLPFGT